MAPVYLHKQILLSKYWKSSCIADIYMDGLSLSVVQQHVIWLLLFQVTCHFYRATLYMLTRHMLSSCVRLSVTSRSSTKMAKP